MFMKPNYTNTPSCFYGLGRGCSYDFLEACTNPNVLPPPMILLPLLSRCFILPKELEKSWHRGDELSDVMVDTMRTTWVVFYFLY